MGQHRRVPRGVLHQRVDRRHLAVGLGGRLDHEQSAALGQDDQVTVDVEYRRAPEARLAPPDLAGGQLDRAQFGVAATLTTAPVQDAVVMDRNYY